MKQRFAVGPMIDGWLSKGLIKKLVLVFGVTLVVFFVLALMFREYVPYVKDSDMADGEKSPLWQLYYYFADPGNQMSIANADGDAKRWIAMIFSSLGSILLSGILISTITNGFEHMTDRWRSGHSYYKLHGHIVIIGSDHTVQGLVAQLLVSTSDYIVVMTSTDVERIRQSLWALCKTSAEKRRVVVNYGHRDSEQHLHKINIAYAREVYILGDTLEFDNIENYHDSLNVECVNLIATMRQRAGFGADVDRLPCHVLFDYKTTYHIFQHSEPSLHIKQYIDFYPFNFYDQWARKVLVVGHDAEDNICYEPLDRTPITTKDSDKYVHLIIIGLSKMGQAMALQAAHIAHYPNYRRRKTKITIIDANANVEMNEFKQKCGELFKLSHSTYIDAEAWLAAEERWVDGDEAINPDRYRSEFHIAPEYRHLVVDDADSDFVDVEWEFINGYDHNPVVQRLLSSYASDSDAIVTVAVCLNITHISLRTAMNLPKEFYDDERAIPILVQQRKTSSIVATLNGSATENASGDNKLRYKHLRPFGKLTNGFDLKLSTDYMVCKRFNYIYAKSSPAGPMLTTIDDAMADVLWNDVPFPKRWSNIFAAASIPTKFRSLGIEWSEAMNETIEPIDEDKCLMLAEVEHNRWNVDELLLGYRPPYEAEDRDIELNKRKRYYKNKYVHYDIRPYDGLKVDDNGVDPRLNDLNILRYLPLIVKDLKPQK